MAGRDSDNGGNIFRLEKSEKDKIPVKKGLELVKKGILRNSGRNCHQVAIQGYHLTVQFAINHIPQAVISLSV
jgi:hypothetical protein